MKKIIWALYDDGFGSWNKLDQQTHQIISIGINENDWGENYYKIDLSITNNNLIKELSKLPKPDVIIASPPCESWSIADNQQRCFRNIYTGGVIKIFTKQNTRLNNEVLPKQMSRDWYKQYATMLIGMGTSVVTVKIIEHFKPSVWIVENPATLKIWDYMFNTTGFTGVINKTYYNCYDISFPKKPTIFMSNVELNLRKENIKAEIKWEKVSGYDKRASIPKELLKNILEMLDAQ